MKIAQIVCSFPPYPGGIGQSAWRLGEILNQEHQVTTFTLKNSDKRKITENINQKIIFLNPWLKLGHGALPFSLLFSLKKFDCLYLHYPFFGGAEIVKLFLLFFPKKKLVIHYHMDTPSLPGIKKVLAWPAKLLEKSLFKKADKILVSSLDYAKNSHLTECLKKYPNKVIEIPFGINTEIFKPRISQDHPTPFLRQATDLIKHITRKIIKKNNHTLLFVGGLDQAHYFKGLKNLLQALYLLKKENWQLNIIGDGNLKKYYKQLSKELMIDDKVKFKGRVSEDELIYHYQSSDILILPSINSHEAFGLVLIEALACGLPVIASNLKGVRGVFNNEKEGLLVKPSDINDLSDKIKYLIENENIRQAMSIRSRQLVLEKYDQNKIADKLLDEFSHL
jgi:glycosyltransferase involved in cell wall biosynthesis